MADNHGESRFAGTLGDRIGRAIGPKRNLLETVLFNFFIKNLFFSEGAARALRV